MARFIFKLETVLEQRTREERARQQAVALLEAQRLAIEARVGEVQTRIGVGRSELRTALAASSIGVPAVRLSAHASLHSMVLLQRAAIELAGLHQKIKAARTHLLTATTARKAVETLKARRFAEWQNEQKRLEERAADDMNVMRSAVTTALAKETP